MKHYLPNNPMSELANYTNKLFIQNFSKNLSYIIDKWGFENPTTASAFFTKYNLDALKNDKTLVAVRSGSQRPAMYIVTLIAGLSGFSIKELIFEDISQSPKILEIVPMETEDKEKDTIEKLAKKYNIASDLFNAEQPGTIKNTIKNYISGIFCENLKCLRKIWLPNQSRTEFIRLLQDAKMPFINNDTLILKLERGTQMPSFEIAYCLSQLCAGFFGIDDLLFENLTTAEHSYNINNLKPLNANLVKATFCQFYMEEYLEGIDVQKLRDKLKEESKINMEINKLNREKEELAEMGIKHTKTTLLIAQAMERMEQAMKMLGDAQRQIDSIYER